MVDGIVCQIDCRLVVAMKLNSDSEVHFLEGMLVPDGLSCCQGEGHILRFGCRGSNRLLLLRDPGDKALSNREGIARVGTTCVQAISIGCVRVSIEEEATWLRGLRILKGK